MTRRRRSRERFLELAAETDPDDGTDPKEFHHQKCKDTRSQNRKTFQLCGQVQDALHSILAACADEVLQALQVVKVEPAPHTGRLRVLVAVPPDLPHDIHPKAKRHLNKALGMLRSEVASAIYRRYAPELLFEVIG